MSRKAGLILTLTLAAMSLVFMENGGRAEEAFTPGLPSPAFSVTNLQGEAVNSQALGDGVRVINFWAKWCGPCRAEVPELNSIHKKQGAAGLNLIGIAIDSGSPAEVKAAAADFGISFPVYLGADSLLTTFHVTVLPTTIVIDKKGNLVAKIDGVISQDALLPLIQDALKPS